MDEQAAERRDNLRIENELKPVKRSRVSRDAELQLAGLIVSGRFAIGDRLPPERELAIRLGINRTSLREALRRMEAMGLITVRPGDGIYVEDYRYATNLEFVNFMLGAGMGLDKELLLSLEETRRIFALKMLELAAERMDEESINRLEKVVSECPAPGSAELLSGDWDYRLYHEIARASRNRVFVSMVNTIRELFGRLRWFYSNLDASVTESLAELNTRVVSALKAGDGKLAVSLVEQRMKQDEAMIKMIVSAM